MKTTLADDIQTLFAATPETGITASALAEAHRVWDEMRTTTPGHLEPMVHLGSLLRLDFHHLLALVLKHKSERVPAGATADVPRGKKDFIPEHDALFHVLAKYGYVPNPFVTDPQSLAWTIREVLLINAHLLANDSPELTAYVGRCRRSLTLLEQSAHHVQESFRHKKSQWLDLQEQLGDQLLFLEARRLANEELTQRWLALFGEAYLVLQEQTARVEGLRQQVELKLSRPELTRTELEQLMREAESSRKAQLRTLQSRLALASLGIIQRPGGVLSPEEVSEYRRQCKSLLRQIWHLLHPDRLTQHANHGRLTERQKATLAELWHRAMTVKESELGIEPGCLGYDHRSLIVLHDILASVKTILSASGIDTDIHLIISGETIEDQIAWLERSTLRLEDELDLVHAELIALLNDPDIQSRTNDLAAPPAEQEEKRQEMLAQARSYRDQAEQLEAQLNHLFSAEDNQI